jgi:hypothetical protein
MLLMEELDAGSVVRTGGDATRQVAAKALQICPDIEIGWKIADIASTISYFPHIHVHKINIPFSGTGPGEWLLIYSPKVRSFV